MNKLRLSIVLLFLSVGASRARADTITFPNTILIIPDGSTVTDTFILPQGQYGPIAAYGVDFTFAGGYGKVFGEEEDADSGFIYFNAPATDIRLQWTANTNPFLIWADTGTPIFTCETIFEACSGGAEVQGPISSLTFAGYDDGYDGITSITFNTVVGDPVETPEPAVGMMVLVGLLGVGGIYSRYRGRGNGR